MWKTTHCKKEHFQGRVPDNIVECVQFKEIPSSGICLINMCTRQCPFKLEILHALFGTLLSIILKGNLYAKHFVIRKNFFTYPVQSSRLDIWSVSHVNEQLLLYDPTDITAKVVLLPYTNNFISFPLLQAWVSNPIILWTMIYLWNTISI